MLVDWGLGIGDSGLELLSLRGVRGGDLSMGCAAITAW